MATEGRRLASGEPGKLGVFLSFFPFFPFFIFLFFKKKVEQEGTIYFDACGQCKDNLYGCPAFYSCPTCSILCCRECVRANVIFEAGNCSTNNRNRNDKHLFACWNCTEFYPQSVQQHLAIDVAKNGQGDKFNKNGKWKPVDQSWTQNSKLREKVSRNKCFQRINDIVGALNTAIRLYQDISPTQRNITHFSSSIATLLTTAGGAVGGNTCTFCWGGDQDDDDDQQEQQQKQAHGFFACHHCGWIFHQFCRLKHNSNNACPQCHANPISRLASFIPPTSNAQAAQAAQAFESHFARLYTGLDLTRIRNKISLQQISSAAAAIALYEFIKTHKIYLRDFLAIINFKHRCPKTTSSYAPPHKPLPLPIIYITTQQIL